MKYITELIINEYRLKNIDFMGYVFNKSNASYHHLIIPKRFGGKETLENGDTREILRIHPYLAPYKVTILPLIKKLHSQAFNSCRNF